MGFSKIGKDIYFDGIHCTVSAMAGAGRRGGGRIFSIEAFPFLETIFVDNFVTAAINKSDGFKVSSTKAFN